jgi:hypothetical protein
MGSYFDTTHLQPADLAQAIAAAKHQEGKVLALFDRYGSLSPSMALDLFGIAGQRLPPLTSIRRAITVLTDRGLLVKTDVQVRGRYGALEHTWRRVEPIAAAA